MSEDLRPQWCQVVATENRTVAGRLIALSPWLGDPVVRHATRLAGMLCAGTICVGTWATDEMDLHLPDSVLAKAETWGASVPLTSNFDLVRAASGPKGRTAAYVAAEAVLVRPGVRPPDIASSGFPHAPVRIVDRRGHTVATLGPCEEARRAFVDGDHDVATVEWADVVVIDWWADLYETETQVAAAMVDSLRASGVYIPVGSNPVVGPECVVEPGASLIGDVRMSGTSRVSKNAVIEGPAVLVDAQVGERAHVRSSVLDHVELGEMSSVGPYAVLRPGTVVGDDTRIGTFVEVSESRIGSMTDIRHLSYVGNSTVGDHVNVGAGVVFAQVNGGVRSGAVVTDGASIGANSTLIGNVVLGRGCVVGAGSEVTSDVPDAASYVRRADSTVRLANADSAPEEVQ